MSDATKGSWADYAFLNAIGKLNMRLSEENRQLLGRLHDLERLGDSQKYRYVDRVAEEVARGDAKSRLSLLSEVARSTRDRIHGLWRGIRAEREREQLQGGSILSTENRPESIVSLLSPSDNLKIGVSFFGGLGDGILISAVIEAIKRKHPHSDIYFFTYHPLHRQFFKDNCYLKEVILIAHGPYEEFSTFAHDLIGKDHLDIWYECKYATKVHYGPRSRVSRAEQETTALAFKQYDFNFDVFPFNNNLLSAFCRERNLSLLDLIAKSALLDLSDCQLYIMPSMEDMKITEIVGQFGEYVTIHHGSDPNWNIRGRRINHQIKNWYKDRWEEVIAHITAVTPLKVIQLGIRGEDTLSGAIHYFMGRTTVQEAALLIKNARFHLDTEGGLVHLARAVHTRSIVLFGPTPIDFFAYPQNINLKDGDCHDCWWSTHEWVSKCPRGMSRPTCMDSIRTPSVIRAVDGLVSQGPSQERAQASDLQLFAWDVTAGQSVTTGISSYALAQIAAHHGERRPLKVLAVGGGQDPTPLLLARAGHESHICDLRLGAAEAGPVKFRCGAIFNLPYESNVFDVVLCSSLHRSLPFQVAALRELLRVLLPGGLAILCLPISGDADGEQEAHPVGTLTERELAALLGAFGTKTSVGPRVSKGIAMGGMCILKQRGPS